MFGKGQSAGGWSERLGVTKHERGGKNLEKKIKEREMRRGGEGCKGGGLNFSRETLYIQTPARLDMQRRGGK